MPQRGRTGGAPRSAPPTGAGSLDAGRLLQVGQGARPPSSAKKTSSVSGSGRKPSSSIRRNCCLQPVVEARRVEQDDRLGVLAVLLQLQDLGRLVQRAGAADHDHDGVGLRPGAAPCARRGPWRSPSRRRPVRALAAQELHGDADEPPAGLLARRRRRPSSGRCRSRPRPGCGRPCRAVRRTRGRARCSARRGRRRRGRRRCSWRQPYDRLPAAGRRPALPARRAEPRYDLHHRTHHHRRAGHRARARGARRAGARREPPPAGAARDGLSRPLLPAARGRPYASC